MGTCQQIADGVVLLLITALEIDHINGDHLSLP